MQFLLMLLSSTSIITLTPLQIKTLNNIIFKRSKNKSKFKNKSEKGRVYSAVRRSYNPSILDTSLVQKYKKYQKSISHFKNQISITNHLRISNFENNKPMSTMRINSKGSISATRKLKRQWNNSTL